MEFKEYEKFVEDVDFMDGALNVYRTKNYIVRQEISIENIEGKTITFSKDTFFRRTEERDLYYNYNTFPYKLIVRIGLVWSDVTCVGVANAA